MLSNDDKAATAATQPSSQPGYRWRALVPVALAALLLQGCAGKAPSPADTTSARPVAVKQQNVGNNIISRLYAQHESWRGTPYRLGGESRSGIDCSALIQLTFRDQFDLELPRTTADLVKIGAPVPKKELAAGDLVFFRTGRRTRHAGIYIEDGRFLHASSRKGVIISRLDNPYWSRHYWTARRPDPQ
ncbi:lipoprotein NlpC [Marinobacterium nitratireducens]|uniref:Lipoprotein NlpC n=1 Tax=Marinobacterium nitratireducens TaxID=518897 RepID=A0A917Z6S9_9GAMM|nr:NlpC/P60 family protein [Marinobacterium nitratireducens]GGO75612.1 lipoprotein NlpC [Marinobacterium nitratireducens]